MCIAKPSRVAELAGEEVILEDGRKVRTVVRVRKGDFVLVGMGMVVERITRKEYELLSSAI